MKLDKITESFKELTPQEKIEQTEELLQKEKNKKSRKQLFKLLITFRKEQTLLEEEITKIEKRPREEKPIERPLENIVDEEAERKAQEDQQKRVEPQRLYGTTQVKIGEEDTSKHYHPFDQSSQMKQGRHADYEPITFTREEEQNLINTREKRLEKERKKYETGANS